MPAKNTLKPLPIDQSDLLTVYEFIGYRVKERRDIAGLSLIEVCEKTGIGKGRLGMIESGSAKNVKIDELFEIAMTCNTTVGYLCGRE